MPRWTTKLTILNKLDRELRLASHDVPWGTKDGFPSTIPAMGQATYHVYSPAGVSHGIEYSFTLEDVIPKDTSAKNNYGMVSVYIDIPYWSKQNTFRLEATGILDAKSTNKLGNRVHNFETSIIVSKNI